MIWYAHIITSNIEPTEMGLGKKLWIYPPRNSDLAALRHQDMGDKPDKMEVGVRNLQSPTKEWVNRREASSFSGDGKENMLKPPISYPVYATQGVQEWSIWT